MKTFVGLLITLTSLTAVAQASTIVSRSGGTLLGVYANDPEGISWTQTGTYQNASIAAPISSYQSLGTFGQGTVYLMNQIGPGTTAANEVAEVQLTNVPAFATTNTTLFTNLTLGPGTYYLITASNLGGNGIGWRGFDNATMVTAADATIGDEFSGNNGEAPYAPASIMGDMMSTHLLAYDIEGIAVTTPTPEPSTLTLAGLTLLLGCVVTRRHRQMQAAH